MNTNPDPSSSPVPTAPIVAPPAAATAGGMKSNNNNNNSDTLANNNNLTSGGAFAAEPNSTLLSFGAFGKQQKSSARLEKLRKLKDQLLLYRALDAHEVRLQDRRFWRRPQVYSMSQGDRETKLTAEAQSTAVVEGQGEYDLSGARGMLKALSAATASPILPAAGELSQQPSSSEHSADADAEVSQLEILKMKKHFKDLVAKQRAEEQKAAAEIAEAAFNAEQHELQTKILKNKKEREQLEKELEEAEFEASLDFGSRGGDVHWRQKKKAAADLARRKKLRAGQTPGYLMGKEEAGKRRRLERSRLEQLEKEEEERKKQEFAYLGEEERERRVIEAQHSQALMHPTAHDTSTRFVPVRPDTANGSISRWGAASPYSRDGTPATQRANSASKSRVKAFNTIRAGHRAGINMLSAAGNSHNNYKVSAPFSLPSDTASQMFKRAHEVDQSLEEREAEMKEEESFSPSLHHHHHHQRSSSISSQSPPPSPQSQHRHHHHHHHHHRRTESDLSATGNSSGQYNQQQQEQEGGGEKEGEVEKQQRQKQQQQQKRKVVVGVDEDSNSGDPVIETNDPFQFLSDDAEAIQSSFAHSASKIEKKDYTLTMQQKLLSLAAERAGVSYHAACGPQRVLGIRAPTSEQEEAHQKRVVDHEKEADLNKKEQEKLKREQEAQEQREREAAMRFTPPTSATLASSSSSSSSSFQPSRPRNPPQSARTTTTTRSGLSRNFGLSINGSSASSARTVVGVGNLNATGVNNNNNMVSPRSERSTLYSPRSTTRQQQPEQSQQRKSDANNNNNKNNNNDNKNKKRRFPVTFSSESPIPFAVALPTRPEVPGVVMKQPANKTQGRSLCDNEHLSSRTPSPASYRPQPQIFVGIPDWNKPQSYRACAFANLTSSRPADWFPYKK